MVWGDVEVMSIVKLLQDTWQGVIYLFIGFIVLMAIGIAFKFWLIALGIAAIALLIILAMLFGVSKWIKIIGGALSIALLFLWLGPGNFFQSLLIAIAIAWVFNKLKK